MYTVFLILAFFSASSAPQDATAPPERVGKEMCLACHDVAATVHATPHASKECEDCHGAGSAHVEAGGDMSLAFRTKSVSWGVAQCQSCHGDAENELASFRFSPHGKNEIACISCHKIHGEKPRFGLLADQVPRTSPEKHWVRFLGQDTACYMGPELLGRALRSPAFIVRMDRLERGRYRLRLEALNAPGEKLPRGEVTERYARALEDWIHDDPAGWWWSHDRWKLKR